MADSVCFALEGVSFAYAQATVLHDLHHSLAPGRLHGIVGPNGSGKTTLLDLLAGLLRPVTGRVLYGNRAVGGFDRRQLAREIALVPQEFRINFGFTVRDVVMMGRHPHMNRFERPSRKDVQAVEGALAALDIVDFAGRPVTDLSGGEKQRVVVARALAQDTPVLLLDEATSSLDIRHTLEILRVCRALVEEEGRTVIAILHDLNLAGAFCDELMLLDRGRLRVAGPPEEVLTPDRVGSVFGVECRSRFDPFCAAWQLSYGYFQKGAERRTDG